LSQRSGRQLGAEAAAGLHPRLSDALAGGLRFDRLWDLALYEPGVGFYDTGGAAGRRADFLTSVELGPLFGACLARRLDALWDAAGRPDRWTLVDAGSGPGTLVRAVVTAQPRCAAALDVVVVERSDAQREGHVNLIEWADERDVVVVSQEQLPERVCGVIVAHELLDNLAARVVQRHPRPNRTPLRWRCHGGRSRQPTPSAFGRCPGGGRSPSRPLCPGVKRGTVG
jgi:SAM-dependent MidA family methyltransferase